MASEGWACKKGAVLKGREEYWLPWQVAGGGSSTVPPQGREESWYLEQKRKNWATSRGEDWAG